MPTSAQSADKDLLVSRTATDAAVRDGLRLFVGRGKRYSVKQLSNASGVADRVIECAIAPLDSTDFRPLSFERLLSISSVIGPEFTCEWLRLAQQAAFWIPDSEETPPGVLAADLSEDMSQVARAAADGKFDRDEKRALGPVGTHLMIVGAQLERASRAA